MGAVSQNTSFAKSPLKTDSNPLYSVEMLQRMYYCMVECRDYTKRGPGRHANRKPTRAVGREAIEVATAVHLRGGDTIVSQSDWLSGEFAATPLACMVDQASAPNAETLPVVVAPEGLCSAIVGIATGVAAGYKRQGNSAIVTLLADSAVLDSVAAEEAMEFAGKENLPILYIFQRVRRPKSNSVAARKPAKDINVTAARCGFPAIPVDGADALAVYRVVQEAAVRARRGASPTLIECHTFRWLERPAIPARHRLSKGLDQGDPIARMGAYLERKNLLPPSATGVGQQ